MKHIIIEKNDANQRLDKFLSKAVPKIPQSLMYKYIRKGRVKINGKKEDISYKLQLKDELQLYINDEFFDNDSGVNPCLSVKFNLDIVYEDENIIVVNKPVGLLVHEDAGEWLHTLINYIKAYLYQKGEYDPSLENSFAPALCHRIDRNTGGLVITAKNASSLRILNEKIKHREIDKFYMCLVEGTPAPKEGVIENYLFKDSKKNRVYVYNEFRRGASKAVTKYKVIKSVRNRSLVEVELISGRTHQIRAQFANKGNPLIGDAKYGTARDEKHKYQALCAYKLIFDFKTPGDELEYLKGLSLTITPPFSL